MFNARLAGGHLYGKQLFTWLSLVVSFMASFVLSFFQLDVLDGIWDFIESVSEGPTLTPPYISDLLKPVSEACTRQLRSLKTAHWLGPGRERHSMINLLHIQHQNYRTLYHVPLDPLRL